MTEPAFTARTRDRVEQEYGREKWPAIHQTITEQRRAEPEAGLARILARVLATQYPPGDELTPRPFVLDGRPAQMPASGGFGAAQFILQDYIARAYQADTDLVMELGSGWGWHIMTTWLTGGPEAASYVAAEYTDAGRQAVSALAELEARLDFRAVPFDYHDPDLSGLGEREHAVVFTAHSLEQIPEVKPEVIEAICGVAKRVTCLHFEPVGWQIDGESRECTSREYAEEHDYNRNLVATLREAEAEGRIAIDLIQPDLFGIIPKNSTTVIRWTSVPD